MGPGVLKQKIGTRSYLISMKDSKGVLRDYQRDVGMIILKKADLVADIPYHVNPMHKHPSFHDDKNKIRTGEFLIVKWGDGAKGWHCAQVAKVLPDRIKVNWYITNAPALADYKTATRVQRKQALEEATFLRTWCLQQGRGAATTIPPKGEAHRTKHLWTGEIPLKDLGQYVQVRNVGLDSQGKMNSSTVNLVIKMDIPHLVGAGNGNGLNEKLPHDSK